MSNFPLLMVTKGMMAILLYVIMFQEVTCVQGDGLSDLIMLILRSGCET